MQAISSRADATLSSSATRSLTGRPALTKSTISAWSRVAWKGWSTDTTAVVIGVQMPGRLGTPGQGGLLNDVRAHVDLSYGQVAAVEIEDETPALDGGLHPVHRPIDGEEAVAGVLEGVELVLLAEPGQLGVDLRDLVR